MVSHDQQSSTRYIAETTFYVRYAETDAMGIVHHASYIVYFEEGRTTYARSRGSDYASFERSGFYLTVTEVNARYIKPVVYGQRLTTRCWIKTMQSRGLTFEYEIVDAESDALHVTGYTKHICITRDGRVAPIPDAWREWAGAI
ncbi:MAG: thioesterase family protein [Chloroflexota bacterium]|nr:thioesterase family protein [Chloroflexota bacterium]